MTRGMVGLLFGLYGVMLFIGSILCRRFMPTVDQRRPFVLGLCLLFSSFVLFTLADSMYMLFAARGATKSSFASHYLKPS